MTLNEAANDTKIERICMECKHLIPEDTDCLVIFNPPADFHKTHRMVIPPGQIMESIVGFVCQNCETIRRDS